MALKDAPELQKYILHDVRRTGESLGSGSFGVVEKVIFDHSLCAGKKIHETLINSCNIGASYLVAKFEQECKLLKQLRYPHIVQFYGIHFFDDSPNTPVLVMELLRINIEDWIKQEGKKPLPLSLKSNILRGVAKGLHHLHTHNPLIIHRDLTAKNVLLTSSMEAKIADLGNACIVPPHHLNKTMTRAPGTMLYMPPEVFQPHEHYTEKLDIFSFGHLALYVMIQELPLNLLPPTSVDPSNPEEVIGRSEIERRSEYFNKLYLKYAKTHDIPVLIKACLHIIPIKRPSAEMIITVFNSFLTEIKDDYIALEGLSRFQMAEKLKENRGFEDSGPDMDESRHKLVEAKEKIRNSIKCPIILEKWKEGVFLKTVGEWKRYSFCYNTETGSIKYYRDLNKAPRQDISSDKIEYVSERRESCEFEIQIKGKGSWILKASCEEERTAWIELLKSGSSAISDPPYVDAPKPDKEEPDSFHGEAQAYDLPNTFLYKTAEEKPVYEQINVQSMNAPQVYDDPGPRRRLSTKKSDKKGLADQEPQIKDAPPSPSRKLSGRRAPEKANQKCPVEAETRKPINQPLLPPPEIQVEGPSDEGHRHYSVIRRENLNAPASDENRRSRNITAEQFDIITDMFMEYYDDVVPGMYSSQQPEEDDGGTYVNMDEIEEDDPYDTIPGDEAEGTYYAIPDNPKKYNLGNEPPLPPKPQVMKRRPANPVSKKPILPPKPNKPFTKPESSSIDQLMIASSKLTTEMLVTEDVNEDYEHRPQWAKASTTDSVQLDDYGSDTLSTLTLNPKLIHNRVPFASGNFGKVYKATLETSQGGRVEVAVKSANKHSTEKEKNDFIREMITMARMLHPNIVYLHGLVLEENLIVLEFLANGDLKTFLQKNPRPVRTLIKYMIDIAMGMHHVSNLGLVHRDLAARNVLVSQNEICKVADFGLIRKVDKGCYSVTGKSNVPIRWCAPECLREGKYSPASDAWSYGIVLWEMANPSSIPYQHYENYQVGYKIAEGEKLIPPSEYPETVQKIMQACWQMQPGKRPSFRYITGLLTRVNLEGYFQRRS